MNKLKRAVALILFIAVIASSLFLVACNRGEKYELEQRNSDELVVLSYNIRTRIPFTDKVDRWNYRKEAIVEHIFKYSPDIIGMQEVKGAQLGYLSRKLEGYSYVGRSREKTKRAGEGVYIFYREDRLELLESEIFWLSETPEKSSFGWDAACKRVVVSALFKDKRTGETFIHFNTHLDHKGETARTNGLNMILDKMEDNGYPAILTGDFNFEETAPQYALVAAAMDDAQKIAPNAATGRTYHGYGESDTVGPIDFCFVSGFDAIQYTILNEKINGRFTSDHFALYTRLIIKAE